MSHSPESTAFVQLQQELAQARGELSRLQGYHRLILDSAIDYAIIATDLTGRIVEWNRGAEHILYWTQDEAQGQPLQMLFTEADRQAGVVEREIGLALGQSRATDDRWHLRKDGSTFWASGLMMPVLENGQFVGVLKIIRDLTAQHHAQQQRQDAAQMAEERFSALANAMPQLVWIADELGRERWFNSRWQTLTGLASAALLNRGWLSMVKADQRREVSTRLEHAFQQQQAFEETFAMRDREGAYRWFLTRAQPIFDQGGSLLQWYGTCTDVDDFQIKYDRQKDANQQLVAQGRQHTADMAVSNRQLHLETLARHEAEGHVQQLQKMEAVGQLTGGIAHDFNNMLTTVIAGLELLKMHHARGKDVVVTYCDIALDGARRAANLTQRLLAFSRQQPLKPEPLDLNRLTANLADMLNRTLGDQVQFENVLHAGLWTTFADAAQLENVIVNLAINARDAMPEGGQLTIETANIYLDDAYAELHGAKPGQHVMLAVTDTGTGISKEHLQKIFEPYFTTKGVGKGTGLGLSQVYGFVKQSQGHVSVYSEPGTGSTFKLYFPRHYGDAAVSMDVHEVVGQHDTYLARAGESVLVVEDDVMVRRLSVDALTTLGYRVLEAANGQAALQLLHDDPGVSLLFTDVVMPGMSGRQLSDQAGASFPGLKVLFTTGYTRNAIVHNGMLDHGVHFLSKPFTVRELGQKVRAVLDA